jgi:Mannosyl-glycoprotein endo-beta-N-acetylglucosaminidase
MTVPSPPKLRRPMTVMLVVALITALAAPAAAAAVGTTPTAAPTTTSPSIPDPVTTSPTLVAGTTVPPTTQPPTTPPPTTQSTPPTTAAPTTTTAPSTTTTTAPTTTTTVVSPAQVAALLQSLNADLARLDAIQAFAQAKAAAAQGASSANAAPAATPVDAALAKAAADDLAASKTEITARHDIAGARHRLSEMAVAMYVHADAAAPSAGTATGNWADRSVLLALLLGQERREASSASRRLSQADAAMAGARARADQLVAARTAAILASAHNVVDTTTTSTTTTLPPTAAPALPPGVPRPGGVAPPKSKSTPVRPPPDNRGPSILGPATLTADELAGWFATTGHVASLTVPLDNLVGDYHDAGMTVGVRADIAFAQAILETGYFAYPAGGQLTTADNNFAGIGACDSCTSGFGFPDAKTGVAAQLQLLHEYASAQPVGGPLPARAGPSGCCGTWMALTGVWATASNYGYTILGLYKRMVEWAIPRRSANAGL